MAYYHCPYCGQERPHSNYGGVGPCNCSGYLDQKARIQEQVEAERKAEAKAKEQQHLREEACAHHVYERVGMHASRCIYCGKMIGG